MPAVKADSIGPRNARSRGVALAESFVDSFKTELITDRAWVSYQALELAVVEYIAWFNDDRLHESLGDIPPAEFEALYAAQTETISLNQ